MKATHTETNPAEKNSIDQHAFQAGSCWFILVYVGQCRIDAGLTSMVQLRDVQL
jgi:hypothetical protein